MKKITLTQGKFAIVDSADYIWLNQRKWYAAKVGEYNWYACRSVNGKVVYMHNVIMGAKWLDHENGNGLDNWRSNLRKCTHQQNQRNKRLPSHNTSGYRGVTWHKQAGKWVAQIIVDGKCISCGVYDDKKEAAIAYDKKAIELFGEFARTNILR